MRVVIFAAGDGHYAIVQIAQGGAEDPKPVLVPVIVKGKSIEFTVNDIKYTGTVSATGLSLRTGGERAETLRRKTSASFFG